MPDIYSATDVEKKTNDNVRSESRWKLNETASSRSQDEEMEEKTQTISSLFVLVEEKPFAEQTKSFECVLSQGDM